MFKLDARHSILALVGSPQQQHHRSSSIASQFRVLRAQKSIILNGIKVERLGKQHGYTIYIGRQVCNCNIMYVNCKCLMRNTQLFCVAKNELITAATKLILDGIWYGQVVIGNSNRYYSSIYAALPDIQSFGDPRRRRNATFTNNAQLILQLWIVFSIMYNVLYINTSKMNISKMDCNE